MGQQRIFSIDIFRGISAVLMVFFSLTIRLAYLPDPLTHNAANSFHLGDLVLPMFLFAGGMSLVFFMRKRVGKPLGALAFDILERIGGLLLVAFFLTLFSVGGILKMDEIMLYLVLMIPMLVLVQLGQTTLLLLSISIYLSYMILFWTGNVPPFDWEFVYGYLAGYLGGYMGAVFYLPVMLSGAVMGKRLADGKGVLDLLILWLVLCLVLLVLIPPYKMELSPSFMALSVLISGLAVAGLGRIEGWMRNCRGVVRYAIDQLEYIGKRSLRFWILMFVFLIIPVTFYVAATSDTGLFPVGLDWRVAVLVSVIAVPFLLMISKGLDVMGERVKRITVNPLANSNGSIRANQLKSTNDSTKKP